jgi:outer membrane protein TolC
MKKVILFLLICGSAAAQNIDYNKIILPEHSSMDYVEKLVQLAWKNHPDNEVLRREVNVAQYDVAQSPAEWLNIVRFTGNMNEFTINPELDVFGRAAFYPRYNISASISLGQLLSIPYNTKKNRERVVIAQSMVNSKKLDVRNAVIKAYNEYVLREKVYKVQTQLKSDNETSHKLIEQRFKNGETTFETYSLSLNNYSAVTIANLEAETAYKNAKADLERLIGVRLEDVR